MSDVKPVEVEMGSSSGAAAAPQAGVQHREGAEPTRFAWSGVTFNVKTKDGSTKTILDNVSGVVEPGEVLYIMGPSGSGKTSLLDALADRIKGQVGGFVWCNKAERDPRTFKHTQGYVQQEDALPGVFTVNETLHHSAALSIDRPFGERADRVNDMIKFLGLTSAKDTKVGNVFFRGLSGGQRRRLSVGVEMISLPSILFLDEPTSGLDSASTFYLMQHVRELARTFQLTVVATIHQPSARVVSMSDKLLLLSKGQTMFFGPSQDLVAFLEATGNPCPDHENPSDFVLDLINSDFDEGGNKHEALATQFVASHWREALDEAVKTVQVQVDGSGAPASPRTGVQSPPQELKLTYKVSWATQCYVLFWRTLLSYVRDPAVVWLRMAMYTALALFVGTVWLDIKEDETQDKINMLFFVAAFLVFMSISVLPAFITERTIFVRERANGYYTVSAWMTASTLASILPLFVVSVVSSTIVYWLAGLNDDFERYCMFVWTLFLSLLCAESIMILVAVVAPVFIVGIALGAGIYGFFMCVEGFFRELKHIGWHWRWASYISMHTYSFANFMYTEFDGREVVYLRDQQMTGERILAIYDFEDTDFWFNSFILIVMAIVYRIIAWYILEKRYTGKH